MDPLSQSSVNQPLLGEIASGANSKSTSILDLTKKRVDPHSIQSPLPERKASYAPPHLPESTRTRQENTYHVPGT